MFSRENNTGNIDDANSVDNLSNVEVNPNLSLNSSSDNDFTHTGNDDISAHDDNDDDRIANSASNSSREDCYSFNTRLCNLTVQIVQGDLTTTKVGGIVNCSLEHGGGVARAIADAAGDELVIECRN